MSESVGMTPHSALSVAVAAPIGGIYDYLAGPAVGAVRGTIVMVPFGGRHLPGIVMGAAIGDAEFCGKLARNKGFDKNSDEQIQCKLRVQMVY